MTAMRINIRLLWMATLTLLLLCPLALAQAPVPALPPVPAAAETPQPSTQTTEAPLPDLRTANFVDFGVRGTSYSSGSDAARFQRYRDLRTNRPVLDGLRYTNLTEARGFSVRADHVGFYDQRYRASYNNYGKLKVSFDYNQIPLFYSRDTATLFSTESPGVLRIDDAIQSGIENKLTTAANVVGQSKRFDLRDRRNVLSVAMTYSLVPQLDWHLSLKNTTKTGSQPWAGTFGFSDAVELAVPLDTRTTELGTALEWANTRGMARVGYDGSFFHNNVQSLVWDNPLRLTDSATGPSQGRMSLWPNSNMNSASMTGALNLPGHSRATGYVSLGSWSQNDALVPFTINTALPAIPLDRASADAEARITAMTYSFTSKPTTMLWVNARYRSYDFDNRTPEFHVANTVTYDTSVAALGEGTTAYSIGRRTFDADASLTPTRFAAFRAGYTREQIKQTFRSFDTTTEDTVRLSADATGVSWLTVRAVYEHARRVGTGLDEQALDDIGEQVSLRQFDISDRTSNRFSGLVQLTPWAAFSINGTAAIGKEERPRSAFGLRSNDNHAYSVGADYVPKDAVSLGLSYTYEKYDALQQSRQANPGVQFDDPRRDWTTDSGDLAHTLAASMDLLKVFSKTDVRFAYDYSHARSLYVYGLTPDSTLPPVVQLPAVTNTFTRGTIDVRYYLTRHLAAGGAYWYDKYSVDDFAVNPQTINALAQPSFLLIGYLNRPYTANTLIGRLTYIW